MRILDRFDEPQHSEDLTKKMSKAVLLGLTRTLRAAQLGGSSVRPLHLLSCAADASMTQACLKAVNEDEPGTCATRASGDDATVPSYGMAPDQWARRPCRAPRWACLPPVRSRNPDVTSPSLVRLIRCRAMSHRPPAHAGDGPTPPLVAVPVRPRCAATGP